MNIDIEACRQFTEQEDWAAITELSGLNLAHTKFGTMKELNRLRDVLQPNEVVLNFTSGIMVDDFETVTDWLPSTWLVALTDRRVLFLDSALLTDSLNQHSILLKNIQVVSAHQGFILAKIVIETGGKRTVVDNCEKTTVEQFAKMANQLLQEIAESESELSKTVTQPTVTLASQIAELSELKNQGALSEEEFTQAKAKLLSDAE